MKKNTFTLKIILPAIFFATLFLALKSMPVMAQTDSVREDSFNQLRAAGGSNGANFGQYRDPRETVARVIRVALGLLGIIFLVLVVYSGFLWMTAGGEEENVSKAKKILTASIIGLAIILAAYSISNFVIYKMIRSTIGGSDDPLKNDFCLKNPNDDFCTKQLNF